MSAATFIYVMGREEGPVKIGISSNPFGRLNLLKAGCFFPMRLFYHAPITNRYTAFEIEQTIHRVLEADNLHGEWFDVDVDSAIEGVETAIQIDEHFRGKKIQPGDLGLQEDQIGFRWDGQA